METYQEDQVKLGFLIHRSQGSSHYSLDLPISLYKCGLIIQNNAQNPNLFKEIGDQTKLVELTQLFLTGPDFGKYFSVNDDSLNDENFQLPEFCSLFTHKIFELSKPLISKEITKELCDLLTINNELSMKFLNVEELDFTIKESSPKSTSTMVDDSLHPIPFVITTNRRMILEKQFGVSLQLAELLFYSFNTKLQQLTKQERDWLIWIINIFSRILNLNSFNKSHQIEYLSTVFQHSILDGFDPTLQKNLKVVFIILIYGVGIILPNIFHDNGQLTNPNIIQPKTPLLPTFSITSNGGSANKEISTPLPAISSPSTPQTSEFHIPITPVKNSLSINEEMDATVAEELALVLEDLKLNHSARMAFRSGKPLLQRLALPPARSAVLVRK